MISDSTSEIRRLKFLKLGGSLITDKATPRMPRLDVLARLAVEIAAACSEDSQLGLVVGHGSGSFAHISASRYGTRQGVYTPEQWQGFVQVWRDAALLNRLVMDALVDAQLLAVAFPPSASIIASDRRLASWDITPLRLALENGLLPVVYGDVVFDTEQGGTIFSTEDLFVRLAQEFQPCSLLLAGLEKGVWADYPRCTSFVETITPQNAIQVMPGIGASGATDVTGGMSSKVQQSLQLVQKLPGLQIQIFSGEIAGNVQRALLGEVVGTLIHG